MSELDFSRVKGDTELAREATYRLKETERALRARRVRRQTEVLLNDSSALAWKEVPVGKTEKRTFKIVCRRADGSEVPATGLPSSERINAATRLQTLVDAMAIAD